MPRWWLEKRVEVISGQHGGKAWKTATSGLILIAEGKRQMIHTHTHNKTKMAKSGAQK